MGVRDLERLARMSRVDVAGADRSGLADLRSIAVDAGLPPAERMEQFLAQVRNPYVFLCGNTPVRVTFSPGGKSLDALLQRYFQGLRQR